MSRNQEKVLIYALMISIGVHFWVFWTKESAVSTPKMPGGLAVAVQLGAAQEEVIEKLESVEKEATEISEKGRQLVEMAEEYTEPVYEDELRENEAQAAQAEQQADFNELAVVSEIRLGSPPQPPKYPEQARRRGQEGMVIVRVLVSALGGIERVELGRSSGFDLLDQAAIEAVALWNFLPAKQGETTITAWMEVPVNFSLG